MFKEVKTVSIEENDDKFSIVLYLKKHKKKILLFTVILVIIIIHEKIKSLFNYSYRYFYPKDGIALCAILKRENKYVREFVEHYKKLEFKKIFLIDNNDVDGERLEEVISDYIDSGYVTVLNARGLENYNLSGYRKCYFEYGYKYKWILYVDLDEFLFIGNNLTISQLMSNPLYSPCDTVNFQWVMYGDNGLVHYDPRPLSERFTEPYEIETLTKPIAKTILDGYFIFVHFIRSKVYCRADGSQYRKYDGYKEGIDEGKYNYIIKFAHIKHFFTKSAEEFTWKMMRGYGEYKEEELKEFVKDRIKLFFEVNELTREKLEVMKKIIEDNQTVDYYEKLLSGK